MGTNGSGLSCLVFSDSRKGNKTQRKNKEEEEEEEEEEVVVEGENQKRSVD